MDPRKIKDWYHFCFRILLKLPSSLRDSGNFVKTLKIRVKLILNCPRAHVILYTNCTRNHVMSYTNRYKRFVMNSFINKELKKIWSLLENLRALGHVYEILNSFLFWNDWLRCSGAFANTKYIFRRTDPTLIICKHTWLTSNQHILLSPTV